MGLLSHIEGADFNKIKSASSILTYYEFISKHSIEICGIFKKDGTNYVLTNSFGLDIKSICNSKSTEDFWTGLIEQDNHIYIFKTEDDTIQTVYQFFSFKMRDVIKSVIVYKKQNSIYFICSTSEETKDYQPVFQDFVYYDTLNFNSPVTALSNEYQTFTLDFNSAINKEFEKALIDSDMFRKCIVNQIFNNLQSYFPSPNTIEKNGDKITVSFKAATPVSSNLFLAKIKENFKDFLINSYEQIEIL